jgi:hypothetical protein
METKSQKRYWCGNARLLSDMFWCLVFASILTWSSNHHSSNRGTSALPNSKAVSEYVDSVSECGDYLQPHTAGEAIYDEVVSFASRVVFCFLMFFIWSWNSDHLRRRFARFCIHLLCWFGFVAGLISMGFVVWFFPKSLNEYCGCQLVLFWTIFGSVLAIKYRSLMWPKPSQDDSLCTT